MPTTQDKAKKTQKSTRLNPKTRLALYILLGGVGLAILLTTGGFTFAASQEQRDSFCSSCHTQPESTFYQRSLDANAVDLASFHNQEKTRCIDCHSGIGLTGRIRAELLGAHNALAFYTKTAVQPAKLTRPVGDESCLKCHPNVAAQQDMNNHFHVFLAQWQSMDPNAAACVSCHQGHANDGDPQIMFLNRAVTQAECESCHRSLGAGD
jgi:nitrate/TMAO reductase-like tetraheme cytochrome c subunit